jgi:hypothetical protein
MDTSAVISWLRSYESTVQLTECHRTTQSGILSVAHAVRNARDVRTVLEKHKDYAIWRAPGFKMMELPAQSAFLARTISDELRKFSGSVAILSPDTGSKLIRGALDIVGVRAWPYRKAAPEVTFGPFQVEWELSESERAQALCQRIKLPDICDRRSVAEVAAAEIADPVLVRVRARMDRAQRVRGEFSFSKTKMIEMIEEAVREVERSGRRRGSLRAAMSIHRAKNREFSNVIVLWPYSARGSADHLRRLLYNAITRAQERCVVIALGKDRLNAAPFAAAS